MNNLTIPQIVSSYCMVEYVSSITDVKKVSSEHECLCLFHNDSKPSMRIYSKNGKQRFHCFVCGSKGDILDLVYEYNNCESRKQAVDILTGRRSPITQRRKRMIGKTPVIDHYADFEPLPLGDNVINVGEWITVLNPKNIKEKPLWKMKPDAVYRYDNAYVVRLTFGKDKNTPTIHWCKQLSTGLCGWVAYPFNESERKYYGAIKQSGSLVVVEGEKAAQCGIDLMQDKNDVSVITWSGGVNAVMKTNWSVLNGRPIILIPDNDLQGFIAMSKICEKYPNAMIVDPSGMRHKWDIADGNFTQTELFDFMASRLISRDEFETKVNAAIEADKLKKRMN